MKYGLLRAVVTMAAIGTGSLELAKAIINTFSFDIFAGCVDGTYLPTDSICEYGPQMSINVVAMLFFFGASYVMLNDDLKKVGRRTIVKMAAHSVIYMLALTFVWRMQISLQDNFLLFGGPETLTEYLYVGFVWSDIILIGIFMGLIWWIPQKVDLKAIDATKRKEARLKFTTPAKKKK